VHTLEASAQFSAPAGSGTFAEFIIIFVLHLPDLFSCAFADVSSDDLSYRLKQLKSKMARLRELKVKPGPSDGAPVRKRSKH
jgi:hypothetical protein